jgi:hypothetical protein
MGSTFAVRRAGIQAAITATSTRAPAAAARVTGSLARTPNKRSQNSAYCPDADPNRSLPDHNSNHLTLSGSESHPDADFLCALIHEQRHDPIDSKRGQEQTDEGKQGEESGAEAWALCHPADITRQSTQFDR